MVPPRNDQKGGSADVCRNEKWDERKMFSVYWEFSYRVWEGAAGGFELPHAAKPGCHQECCVSDAD